MCRAAWHPMTRPARLCRRLLLVVAVLLSGCGSSDEPPSPLPTRGCAAAGGRARLGGALPGRGPALVFRGAHASRSRRRLGGGHRGREPHRRCRGGSAGRASDVPSSFGVMLFPSGRLDEVEQRSADGELPGLRAARRFEPPLPAQARSRRELAWHDRGARIARGRPLPAARATAPSSPWGILPRECSLASRGSPTTRTA